MVKLRYRLLILVAALCAATTGRAQYVEDSIDVGAGSVGSLAYNSREDVIYGASESGVFFAISCDSNNVVRSLPVHLPHEVVYDSVDNRAYCVYADDSLLVVNGASHSRMKSLFVGGLATMPVWDADFDRVYVSCQDANQVAVVNCATDSLLTYIPVGASPMKMYINTLRGKLYVLNYDDGTVSIVDMTANQAIKTVNVGGTPNAGCYCRSADKFYSAGAYGYCTVIDGAADSIVARIQLPGTNADIRAATGNEKAGTVYLATDLAYVATVRTKDDSLLAASAIGGELRGIACYDKSGLVYCASVRNDAVYVISTDGEQVLATLPVGNGPYVFAVAPQHDRLYVGHLAGRYVYVLGDTSTGIADRQSPSPRGCDLGVTPSPFSQCVTVVWNAVVKGGDVVGVYSQDGRVVRRDRTPAGQSSWVWDGRDDAGARLPPGVYVIEAGPGLRAKVVKLR